MTKTTAPLNHSQPSKHKDASVAKARLRLWLKLLKATRHIEAELRDKLRVEFESTLPRFDVMAALARAEAGLKMSELSGVLRVSNGNVTGLVDRLVEDGLVVRKPVDNDRRATIVHLTQEGRSAFSRMAVEHEGWIDTLLREVDISEIPDFAERLERIASTDAKREG